MQGQPAVRSVRRPAVPRSPSHPGPGCGRGQEVTQLAPAQEQETWPGQLLTLRACVPHSVGTWPWPAVAGRAR